MNRSLEIKVSWLWTQEVARHLETLRTFRVMMFILKYDHPDVHRLVTDIIRGIDTRHGLAHNRNTLDKPDNETTSS